MLFPPRYANDFGDFGDAGDDECGVSEGNRREGEGDSAGTVGGVEWSGRKRWFFSGSTLED